MQTFRQLSEEERLIIKNVYRAKAADVNTAFVIGFMSTLLGIFFSFIRIHFHERSVFLLLVIIVLLIIGLAALLGGIRTRTRNKRLFKTAMELDKKEIITGHLKQVEIIKGTRLRYHFAGFSKDVHINIRPLYGTTVIEPLKTLTNLGVDLHIISLSPDENVLLKAFYEQPFFSGETVVPLTAEDKNKLMPWLLIEYRLIAFVVLIIGGILSLVAGFDPEILPFTIGFPTFIVLCVFIPRIILVKISRNKILLTTRITESIHLSVKAGKYSSKKTVYRIDNGLVEDYWRADLQAGDIVCVGFIQKKNGSRGLLLGVEKK